MTAEEMKNELQKRLKESRFIHSLGVADTAVKLSKKFGADEKKAYIAGLLHDAAREFKNEDLIFEAKKRSIEIDEVERATPLLLHAPIGAVLVKERYGVIDEEISLAIATHTVAGRNMTKLQKIIYFADMIEPNREYPGVNELREFAQNHTLDEIMLKALSESIIFVIEKNGLLHPDTIAARNELLKKN
ncbi:MAG: bis(5'-nucleosyl)-tetraphosphatase (symmetrical) YqeK [Selenomonadaceae bacterium]|nr:bis(5'-nucleosyl)-tetraphosphatase (symmetrical) YqeK [Selenomonadaceae bacterium]